MVKLLLLIYQIFVTCIFKIIVLHQLGNLIIYLIYGITMHIIINCEVKYQSRVDQVKGLSTGDRFMASGSLMSDDDGLIVSIDELVNQTGRGSQDNRRSGSGRGGRRGRSGRFRD